MKKKILYVILIGILTACGHDDDTTTQETDLVGDWILIQISGRIEGSETSGADMEWQETYSLYTDGTFEKTRIQDSTTTVAAGTYTYSESTNGDFLEFNFSTDSDIIGSCFSNLKEEMVFDSENTFSSSWIACDGPGLIYEKAD
ncbi:hypothetical protein [Formosa algae]|uniref:Lipocalin-like domain-containing protein n=1 Tax=Formosa algae TaxID=225843 RepID=A0A9X0YIA1_9FLAO|nr:hypothetical protein [Formosa algae]MBP1838886.1 hypothetical protein [Formosa algae]MDQ0333663.1 hypothetical protein [Formosa algae]OEI78850.1 hypothetical protein AST99_16885 [Formosa algae]